jgi:hypothetical protein
VEKYCLGKRHQKNKRRFAMAIKLIDIPNAFDSYLNSKVHMTISKINPAEGIDVNPNEEFTFGIRVTNAPNLPDGTKDPEGFTLRNVRYRVFVGDSSTAKLIVPSKGTARNKDGPLAPGAEVGDFTFNPSDDKAFDLEVNDTDTLAVTGKAGSDGSGGTTEIFAIVHADLDLNEVLPKGVPTLRASKTLVVTG